MKKALLLMMILLSCFGVLFAEGAQEAAYPARDITMVIPFGAGGGTDVWARAVGAGLAEQLGVNVTPTNITGGSAGSTGVDQAWKAAHDGYTLCGTSETPLTIPVTTPIDRTAKDYEYFIAAGSPGVVCINADLAAELGIATMADLVAYGDKESLNVAGTTGGLWFALASLLTEEAYGNLGFDFVPFPGSADAIKAVAGGVDAQIVAASLGEVKDYIAAGTLLPLAHMDTVAYENIPSVCDSVPALAPYFPLRQWLGFKVPSDTPAATIATLTEAFNEVMKTQAIKDMAEVQAAEIFALTGAEAKAMAMGSEKSLCWVLADLGKTTFSPADRGIERP